jgi:hypothetical protein
LSASLDLSCAGLAEARARYETSGFIKLERFLPPQLLSEVAAGVEAGIFETKEHGRLGVELCLRACEATAHLTELCNRREVLRFVEDLTDSGHLGCFEGRVYRLCPNAGHRDDWHTDMIMGRMVAMSLNLGTEPYEGGTLRIRNATTQSLLAEVPNVGPGDAVLFRLSHELEHRVTEVHGSAAKTAWAGWFRARPEYRDIMDGRANW